MILMPRYQLLFTLYLRLGHEKLLGRVYAPSLATRHKIPLITGTRQIH